MGLNYAQPDKVRDGPFEVIDAAWSRRAGYMACAWSEIQSGTSGHLRNRIDSDGII